MAIAAEPDQLYALASFVSGLGAEIAVAVTRTATSPILAKVPAQDVNVGDLGDFEELVAQADCDLLLTHSHGRQAAERLGIPLMREWAQSNSPHHTSEQLNPFRERGDRHDGHTQIAHH